MPDYSGTYAQAVTLIDPATGLAYKATGSGTASVSQTNSGTGVATFTSGKYIVTDASLNALKFIIGDSTGTSIGAANPLYVKQAAQAFSLSALATNVTATGAQATVDLGGLSGPQTLEASANGNATSQAVTFAVEGSLDGTNWYTVAVAQVNGIASPAYATSITLTTGTNGAVVRATYSVRDTYRYLRVNPSANTLAGAGNGLNAQVYATAS